MSENPATILLVEDESMVREMIGEMLRNDGYRVIEAENGEKALALCQDYREKIDLILTDIVMPRMDGQEFVRKSRQLRSDFKTLYMSGYNDRLPVMDGETGSGEPFLQKPFRMNILMGKIREILSTP